MSETYSRDGGSWEGEVAVAVEDPVAGSWAEDAEGEV